MLSVKKLEDTVQCKWSIDYKGFLKCTLKRNENAEGAQSLLEGSPSGFSYLFNAHFKKTLQKLLCWVYLFTRHVKVVKVDRESKENKLTGFPRDFHFFRDKE